MSRVLQNGSMTYLDSPEKRALDFQDFGDWNSTLRRAYHLIVRTRGQDREALMDCLVNIGIEIEASDILPDDIKKSVANSFYDLLAQSGHFLEDADDFEAQDETIETFNGIKRFLTPSEEEELYRLTAFSILMRATDDLNRKILEKLENKLITI